MKKIALALTLLIATLLPVPSSAQRRIIDTSKPDKILTVGARIGLNSSGMDNNYLSLLSDMIQNNFYWRMGGQIGGVVDLHFRKFFALETGVFWELRNYECALMSANYVDDYMGSMFVHSRANYLNFPVVASFRLNIIPQSVWHFDLGIYYAYGLSGKKKTHQYYAFSDENGQLIFDQQIDKTNYFKAQAKDFLAVGHSDFGLRIGTGITFLGHYFFGVYYQRGLKNIAKNIEGAAKVKLNNVNWHVNIGYNF